jgi:HlyD family secretion protein
VVSKNLEVGEWVTPGTPILTVDDLSTIWARVDMEETDLGAIRVGGPAQVTLPTRPPLTFPGQVMAIGQEGQFATETDVRRGRQDIRTFYVKVRVLQASGQVKPGMTAEVAFALNNGIAISSNTGERTH